MIWFSADYHWGHANIIKYCNRPFSSVEEMNETIIANHNKRVKPDDFVYFLGDLTFQPKTADLLERVNGKFVWVMGNHDKHIRKLPMVFDATLRLKGGKLVHLVHRPENADLTKDFNCVGHVHEKWKVREARRPDGTNALLVNVGVDVWNFRPVSLDEVVRLHKEYRTNKLEVS